MGLTQKILLFTSVLVVALVVTSLVFTTMQADRLAEENVTRGLTETRQVWETFQAPGLVRVYCNIHPQMSAVVLVRDNPYFAHAAEDGAFSIADVPPGRYTLKAWHERAGEVSQPITVADGDARADLVLDASSYKRVSHKRKDGSNYGPGEKY